MQGMRFFRFSSLASKLALLYAVTSFSILLVASAVLYWSVVEHLQTEHQGLLKTKIEQISDYFAHSLLFGEQLQQLIDVEHHHSEMPHSSAIHPAFPHHVFVRIVNSSGDLIIQSQRMPDLPDDFSFPVISEASGQQILTTKFIGASQLLLLGVASVEIISAQHKDQLFIQALLELQADETLLTAYRSRLIAVLVVGVALAAITGYWVTRRGLRPLDQMSTAIQNINAEKLHQRIDTQQMPTEIAFLANTFNDLLARLDDSFERLSGFSSDLAHELRTPVNNIMGEAEVALSKSRSSGEYIGVLASTMEECSRLTRMIDELLFLAKAENPQTQINCQQVSIDDAVQTLCDYYFPLAEDKSIHLSYPQSNVILFADPGLLHRALGNILENAIRYSDEKSEICINVEQAEKQIILRVSDQGVGIAEDQVPFIFDRFFRVDKSRQRSSQGSGLGLAIVKSIMYLHQGDVRIYSKEGEGTQVGLYFPHKKW